MSFLGGPECSTGANPLAQFQKQSAADTSLQRDRLTQRPPQLNGFRNQQLPDDAQFQEFQQQGPGFNEQLPQDANYQQQLFLLEQQQQQQARAGGGDGWAGEFAQQPPTFSPEQFAQQQGRNGAFSPQDFSNFRQQQMSPASRQAQTPVPQQQSLYQRPPMYGSTFGGSGFGMQRPMMFQPQQPMYGQQPQEQYQGKGKGRIQELSDTDWEEQFKELSTVDKEGELDQLDADAEQAIEAELNQMDRYATPLPFDLASCDPALTLHCGVGGQHGNKMVRDAGFGEFEDIWQGYQAEANVARDMLGDEGHMGEYDEWKDFDGMSHDFDGLRTFENRGPESSNYLFEENNLFDDVPNAFEEGLKIMREGGSLSLAALAFEAAVQKQPEMVEAWVALGSAQAQNEKESPAIRAMEQALKLDSNNLDALMGLSVSYTNEGYDSLAYRTLERWVSVKYPQLGLTPQGLDEAAQAEEEMGFTDRHQLHEKVTALFLEAAQLNPEGMDVDIDVQVGLGVLFYGSEDYDKAVDCFNAALDSAETGTMKREGEEHLLWNRLGATLANSGRSEEAIEAYSRALELRSNFVRARYNLGVSCINLGVLEQAAGHLLGALSMHRVIEREGRMKAAELLRDGNGNAVDDREVEGLLQQNQSTNLYDTLRRVFTQMDRRDLSEGEESESVSQPQVYVKVLRGDTVSDAEATKARWAIPNAVGGFDFADSISPPQKSLRRLSSDILSGGGGSVVGSEEVQIMVDYGAGESDSTDLSTSHWSLKEVSSDTRPWGSTDRGEMTFWTDAPVAQGEELPAAVTTEQETAEENSLGELRAMVQRSREQRYRHLESQAGVVQENDRNLQQVEDEIVRRDHEQLMAEYAGLNAQAVTVPTFEVSTKTYATFSEDYEKQKLQESKAGKEVDFKETLKEYAMKNIADMKGIGETSSKVWKQVEQLGAASSKPVLDLIDRGEATWWLEEEHRALMNRHNNMEEDYQATLEEINELVGRVKMIVDPQSLRNHEEQFQELRDGLEDQGEMILDNMTTMRNKVDRFLSDLKRENVHSPTRNTMEFAKYGANYYEIDVSTTMFGGMFACALEDLAAHPANTGSYWQERVDACREAMVARSHSGPRGVETDIAEFKQNVQLVRDLQNEFGSPQHPNLIIDGRIGRALVDNALAFKGDAEARARTAVSYVDLPGSLRDYGYHMTMENQALQDRAVEAASKNCWAAECSDQQSLASSTPAGLLLHEGEETSTIEGARREKDPLDIDEDQSDHEVSAQVSQFMGDFEKLIEDGVRESLQSSLGAEDWDEIEKMTERLQEKFLDLIEQGEVSGAVQARFRELMDRWATFIPVRRVYERKALREPFSSEVEARLKDVEEQGHQLMRELDEFFEVLFDNADQLGRLGTPEELVSFRTSLRETLKREPGVQPKEWRSTFGDIQQAEVRDVVDYYRFAVALKKASREHQHVFESKKDIRDYPAIQAATNKMWTQVRGVVNEIQKRFDIQNDGRSGPRLYGEGYEGAVKRFMDAQYTYELGREIVANDVASTREDGEQFHYDAWGPSRYNINLEYLQWRGAEVFDAALGLRKYLPQSPASRGTALQESESSHAITTSKPIPESCEIFDDLEKYIELDWTYTLPGRWLLDRVNETHAALSEGIDALAKDGVISPNIREQWLELTHRKTEVLREVRAQAEVSEEREPGIFFSDVERVDPRLMGRIEEIEKDLTAFSREMSDDMWERGTRQWLVPSWMRGEAQSFVSERAGKSKL
ncbi:Peroxisomal membrane signal receptor PTS1 [Elasticomyces elasticus]|nr:Peroxisomal membrane signal receptor PTS1 [Elasticomyces elasticus]